MSKIPLDVIETYYGDGVKRRDGKLEIHIVGDPSLRYPQRPFLHKLVLDVQLPVYGRMLATTTRTLLVDEDLALQDAWVSPAGAPQVVTKLVFDPQGSRWEGLMVGEWPVKKLRIRKGRTLWQRLR